MLAQQLSAPARWGCAHARTPAAQNRQHVCRAGGQKDGDWQKDLAQKTGRRYVPREVKDEEWTSASYDMSNGPDYLPEEAEARMIKEMQEIMRSDSESDDEWSNNFDDYKGVVKDEEIFNINSGWSVSDYMGDGKQSKAKAKAKQKPKAKKQRSKADDDGDYDYDSEDEEDEKRQRLPRLGMAVRSVLKSVPENVLRELEQQQVEADDFNKKAKAQRAKRKNDKARIGSMRIITGSAAGKRLASPPGEGTRPMMEKVRGAVFSMVASMAGSQPLLPPGSRWLDLFAGTGAVGLEALSRGCEQCTFIEMDPAVARDSLTRNINTCGVSQKASILMLRAEDYLKNARNGGRFRSGKAFDFVSVCPPYEEVSYEELFDLLDGSPLLHSDSIVVVEYPKLLSDKIRDAIGPLQKIRDKRYGRTFLAVYGPSD